MADPVSLPICSTQQGVPRISLFCLLRQQGHWIAMPARYNSSAASSLYSQPTHSRASSRTAVVTPLEDFRTSRYIPTDTLAPVEAPRAGNVKNLSRASTRTSKAHTAATTRAEPYDSYFSIPVARDTKTDTLSRRRTTKELVGKFESLSYPSVPSRRNTASSKQTNLVTPESREKKKGKSPIRQSFRNILSVFSKKGRLNRDSLSTAISESLDGSFPVNSLHSPSPRKLEPLTIPGSQAPVASPIACNTPSSLHSGKLFHMSRQTSESLPVWTDCDVLLHPTHILITWMTTLSNPSTEIVALAQCTDVRSLAVEDLAEGERGMLPTVTGPNGLFVFELLFEGRGREKFAAASLKDRAGWVSAIWDAVLRMSEEKTYTPSINALREITQLETPIPSPLRGCVDAMLPLNSTTTESVIISTNVESELPPPPTSSTAPQEASSQKTPVGVTLYDPPVPKPVSPVPTPTPSRTAPSLLSTPTSTKSQSPSIRNLDRISVVKQRLAEIEASTSRSNSPQFLTDKSTRGRQVVRPLSDSPTTTGPKRSVLLRHGTITTIGGDSIMSVPASEAQESPLQRSSRPLVSIPSGESLETEANPWSMHSRLTTPEPLRRMDSVSVSSRYSAESPTSARPSSISSHTSNAAKPLPQLVLALREAALSSDGDPPSSMSRLETPKSTRSLSIFSPTSPYSYDASLKESGCKAGDEETQAKAQTPLSVHKLTPVSSPLAINPSRPECIVHNYRSTPQISQERSDFSEASNNAAHHTAQSASPKSRTNSIPQALQTPPVVMPPQLVARDAILQAPEPRLPLAQLSVFSPKWRAPDENSIAESQPAALFSCFAKVLPDLPNTFASEPPVVQEEPSPPSPSSPGTRKESRARLSVLEGKLDSVQTELQDIPRRIRDLVAEKPAEPHSSTATVVQDQEAKKLLQGIDDGLKRIEDIGANHVDSLGGVHAKIDKLLAQRDSVLASMPPLGQPAISGLPNITEQGAPENVVTRELMDKLEEMRSEFRTDLPALTQRLEELLAAKSPGHGPAAASVDDAALSSNDGQSSGPQGETQTIDTSAIHQKLDELLMALQTKASATEETSEEVKSEEPHPLLQQVLDLLSSDKEDRAKVIEQQADSARYLNELNTWLETFVSHGTSQIESVAGGVQQLCSDLGPTEATGEEGQPVQRAGLLADIRQLLAENKGRGEELAALHGSVGGLLAAVQENLQQGAELRSMFNQETMASMIDQQRHHQEQMLRNLAHELSDDIRGERLRFVEAMKEATTINVQIHVEEFKKELTREVMLMTQEVDRLHKERQGLEQHIADLFAFYAKQKQMGPGDRRKGKNLQQRSAVSGQNAGPQNPPGQNVYYGVPGVPGFMGPAV